MLWDSPLSCPWFPAVVVRCQSAPLLCSSNAVSDLSPAQSLINSSTRNRYRNNCCSSRCCSSQPEKHENSEVISGLPLKIPTHSQLLAKNSAADKWTCKINAKWITLNMTLIQLPLMWMYCATLVCQGPVPLHLCRWVSILVGLPGPFLNLKTSAHSVCLVKLILCITDLSFPWS